MRILQSSGDKDSIPPAAGEPTGAAGLGRLEELGRITKSILQRLQFLEAKLQALEGREALTAPVIAAPVAPSGPSPAPAASFPKITVNEEALKKGLFEKMWKSLNDEGRP